MLGKSVQGVSRRQEKCKRVVKNAIFLALVRTDVSEEGITIIIRVERISELGTTLAVTSN
jgi:hypothetical protein